MGLGRFQACEVVDGGVVEWPLSTAGESGSSLLSMSEILSCTLSCTGGLVAALVCL